MRKRYLYFAVLILALVGLVSTIILFASEIVIGGVCPKAAGIPLCYIVLLLISAVFVSHIKILRDKNIVFFIAAFSGLIIAVIMSVLQFNDCAQCPKAFEIIPMCYLSMILFGGLISLKIWEIRQKL